jgi:hypothetical protein
VCSTSGGSFPPGHVLFTLGLLHLHQRAESSFGGLRWSALLFQNVVVFEAMVVLKMVKTNQIWFEMVIVFGFNGLKWMFIPKYVVFHSSRSVWKAWPLSIEVPVWMRSLFQIVIGMFPVSNYYLFEAQAYGSRILVCVCCAKILHPP